MKTRAKMLLIFFVVTLSAMGKTTYAKAFSKEVTISNFQKLTADGNMHLVLINDGDGRMRIEGTENAIATVVTEQNNGELSITRNESTNISEPVTVYIPVSNMNTLIISGDASVECETTVHAKVFSLLHKGTGTVKLKSDASVIQTMTTKSGRIAVEGEYTNTVSRMDASNHLIVAYTK